MARATPSRNGWFTDKKVTYHRDVAKERRERIREAKAERAARIRQAKADAAQRKRDLREEEAAIKKAELAERRAKLERKRADAVDRKIEREWKAKGYKNPAKGGKRNPEAAAADLSEAWHGRPAKTATDIIETIRYHGVLTELGQLQEIKILVTARKAQAIRFDDDTFLCSSENGKQLYVVGGDQSLDLGALGIEGEEAEKDCVMVGEVYSLTYVTDKQHLGRADKIPGPYEHVLAEEGGNPPVLIYDALNRTVGFTGGTYRIDPTDYDGKHSAGLRD